MEKINDRISFIKGDITKLKTDAIVNAANSSLLGGGGVDGAIHKYGGSTILDACKEIRKHHYPDGLPPGKAVITTAGNLPCKNVIHTVGPIWHGGNSNEKNILKEAYISCLNIANETGINSIAFPAISTGIYGFPKDLAASISYKTINSYLNKKSLPRLVHLIFYTNEDKEIYIDSIQNIIA